MWERPLPVSLLMNIQMWRQSGAVSVGKAGGYSPWQGGSAASGGFAARVKIPQIPTLNQAMEGSELVSCTEGKYSTVSGELLPKAEVVAALNPSSALQTPLWDEAVWTPLLRRTLNTHLVHLVTLWTKTAARQQKSWCFAQFIGGNLGI